MAYLVFFLNVTIAVLCTIAAKLVIGIGEVRMWTTALFTRQGTRTVVHKQLWKQPISLMTNARHCDMSWFQTFLALAEHCAVECTRLYAALSHEQSPPRVAIHAIPVHFLRL
ncbi:unnamed protein product, partial [Iphiclides podalirius]